MKPYTKIERQYVNETLSFIQSAINVLGKCPGCGLEFERGFCEYGMGHLTDCDVKELMQFWLSMVTP